MLRKLVSAALLCALLVTALRAEPPSGGDYVINSSTIDNGGGVSAGGDFVLSGTIGQPEANVQASNGSSYQLTGGFWANVATILSYLIFKDGFE